jgi:hypothetical protein
MNERHACSDWVTHQHRDTLASIVGHPTLTSFLAIADGESKGRVKFEMTEVIFFSFAVTTRLDTFAENASAVWTSSAERRGLEYFVYKAVNAGNIHTQCNACGLHAMQRPGRSATWNLIGNLKPEKTTTPG